VRGTLNVSGDRDTGWTVEGRIPWTDLAATGGRPAPGEVWRLNLARVDGAAPGSDLSSTAPLTQRNFHRTKEYSRLRFAGPEPIARAPWANTRLLGTPDGPEGFQTVRAWPKLVSRQLVAVAPTPDGEWLWFIEQESGREGGMRLRRYSARGDGGDAETLLEPDDYCSTSHFIRASRKTDSFSRRERSREGTAAILARDSLHRPRRPAGSDSRLIVIEWPSDGHNGAALAFGADGRLFVTSGDGTTHSDLDRVGQDPRTLRSKILRIDVDRPADGRPYSIPAGQPLRQRHAGLRRDLGLRPAQSVAADLRRHERTTLGARTGRTQWEYARLVRRGENYGWSVYEGAHPFGRPPLGPHP
jgi:glucose/arabinose dehydrogenase